MNNHEYKRAVHTALYRIAMASRFAERTKLYVEMKEVTEPSHALSLSWQTNEQAFIFAIYERAVFDEFGINIKLDRRRGVVPAAIPNETARTGLITLPSGKRTNILELLGIEPAWAAEQLEAVTHYTQKKAA